MANVVMAATPIYGHVAPMRTIAADLIRRGHRVVFTTGSTFRPYIQQIGAEFVPLSGKADYDVTVIASLRERTAIPLGPERLAFDWQVAFIAPIPDQHRTLQHIFAGFDGQPFVLLADSMFWGGFPVLLGAPGVRPTASIGVGVVPLNLLSVDHGPFASGLPYDPSPEGQERNAAANAVVQDILFKPAQEDFERIARELGATERPEFLMNSSVALPDRFLQLTVPGMEYPRTDAPPGLRYVGVLEPERHNATVPTWWPEVTSGDRPVVVITQGTVANLDTSELIEPAAAALADLDALVVVTAGREVTLPNAPANCRVAPFIPYDRLLPHSALMVGNGGYGGVQQAISFGVPLVLAGLSEDKAEVCARTAWAGAAINLATQRPAVDQIRKAVDLVLSDPSYRTAAQRLAAEYRGHDPLSAIDMTIAELLARS